MITYWGILEKVRGSTLRLTRLDDDIYEHLKRDFPELDPAATIDEDEMKSKAGKDRWRKFMMAYEKKVDDYNFGTLVRLNPKWEYGQKESIFGRSPLSHWLCSYVTYTGSGVRDDEAAGALAAHSPLKLSETGLTICVAVPRMQFYAVEIAR